MTLPHPLREAAQPTDWSQPALAYRGQVSIHDKWAAMHRLAWYLLLVRRVAVLPRRRDPLR